MKKVAIIGGGASGLLAAYFAAKKGNRVTLFEKQKCLGRKILITGNGRCNISNMHIDQSKYYGHNTKFINNVFARFSPEDTRNFFQSIGIPFVEEKNGKLFPASLQSSSVTSILEYEISKKNVDIKLHRRIEKIINTGNAFTLITAGKEKLNFDSVILSAGSPAYPQLGGSTSGYELAASLGHRVYEPFPAILPINIPLKALHRLQGIKWDVKIKATHKNKTIASSAGELLFTAFGISGPASLDVSRKVNELIINGELPEIIIDFFPDLAQDGLLALFESLWTDKKKSISFSLAGILKNRMPEVLLKICGLDPEKKVGELSKNDKTLLIKSMKALALQPGGPRGFKEAVIAAGGVDVNELDPGTMESKIAKNLFITGELLDIDGISGGYNLQFAWSTGAIAGKTQ